MGKNKAFKKAKESSLKLNVPKVKKIKKNKKDLQRTEAWKEDRKGRWTGSQFTALMTCSQGKGNLKWDNIDKIFEFGKTALKYIYENAMERKTGRYIDEGDGTQQMRYGTLVEPLIAKAAKKLLKKEGKLKKVGFKEFPTMPNAGVSSDRILKNKKGKTIAAVEMKACTNWGTHYERTFESINEGSKDFWQVQGQTVAWEVDTAYYIVAEPPSDIKKYLYYEGDIMDLYKEFLKDCPLSLIKVKASRLHQEALLKRVCIAEQALNDWISLGGNLKKTLDKTIEHFHNNPKDLNKYIPPLGLAAYDKKKREEELKVIQDNNKKKNFKKPKNIVLKHEEEGSKENKSKLPAVVGRSKVLVSSNKKKRK